MTPVIKYKHIIVVMQELRISIHIYCNIIMHTLIYNTYIMYKYLHWNKNTSCIQFLWNVLKEKDIFSKIINNIIMVTVIVTNYSKCMTYIEVQTYVGTNILST